ncbi:MAG: alpha/beta hydrolase [Proteobacteria bacterium]|nr:alpha/beta hydrolase [Pseudomonadota bacterium]
MTAFEPIVGRYLPVDCEGRRYRIYVEEAGQGIPLLCLHTAGSDTRQFRGVLNDSAVTKHYRVIAFDLPWHGKSSPPAGWQTEEYQLTIASYTAIIRAMSKALTLDRPVVMGCSIGGRIVLNLAVEHAREFRAIIGLQSSAYVEPYYDISWLHRPDVHGGEVAAGYVSGLMAPMSPEAERWETIWHYMQGGPGVFKGDLHFYKIDGDIRDRIGRIDTRVAPLYLLTGEYDYSASPAHTQEAADQIKGAKVVIMKELGHFPMSENPERFLGYLRPVLDAIRERA